MVNGLKEKNTVSASGGEALPSRAKYYYNTQDGVFGERQKDARIAYDGFVLSRTANPDMVLKDIKAPSEELSQDIRKGNPDILPTGTTLRMLNGNYKAPEKPFESDTPISLKVNAKGKFILSVYVVLVLSLILVIALNAIAISRSNEKNNELSGQIVSLSNQVEEKAELAASGIDSEKAAAAAQQDGMSIKPYQDFHLQNPVINTQVCYQKSTNWFDRLCDFFS